MKAVINKVDTWDENTFGELEREPPFVVDVNFTIAPEGSTHGGGDLFALTVVSSTELKQQLPTPAHALCIERFDPVAIRNYVQGRLNTIQGRDWDELAPQIALFMSWEFEGYISSY